MSDIQEKILELMDLFDEDEVTTADKINRPEPKQSVKEIELFNEFNIRNPKAGGGMLVKPSVDGSRPGYAKDEYSRIMALGVDELKDLGFTGKKTKKVKAPGSGKPYSKLTDEFKSWVREQTAASPDYRKKDIQFKTRELRVINAIENAYNQNDVRHIITKDKFNKIGSFKATDYPIITAMKKDPEKLKSISAQTNIPEDDLLNLLEDRDVFIKNKYNDVRNLSVAERTKPKKKFYASAEKWILRNSKRYADPDKFYNAFIRTFGEDNHFIKSIQSGKKTGFKVAFSDKFVEDVLGLKSQTSVNPKQLKDIFKTSIYTNNSNVRQKIVDTLTDIIPTNIKFAKDYDVRNALLENPLLKKFGLNQSIKGPIAKLLADDLIDITLKDISSFRKPFLGTRQLLSYLSNRVDPKYRSMFEEATQAVIYAQNNQWKDAKAALNLSQKIMFDHKIPQALIKLGYADDLDYIKLTPTSEDFNTKVKLKQFDQPMITLANEFSKPTTSLDRKAEIVQQMKILQTNFNSKYGNYLGSIDINYDNKTGKLKLTNVDPIVTKKTDFVSSLGRSLTQTGEINKKQLKNLSDGPRLGALDVPSMFKRLSPATRKLVGGFGGVVVPEVLFYQLDKRNRMSKGQSEKEAAAGALESGTLGLYNNKAYMEELKKTAKSMGIDSNSFDSAYQLNLLVDRYNQSSATYEKNYEQLLEMGDEKRAEDLKKNFDKYTKNIQDRYSLLANNISDNVMNTVGASPLIMKEGRENITQKQFDKPFFDMQDVALEKLKREAQSVYPIRARKVNPAEGSEGTRFYNMLDFIGQGFKNIALGRANPNLMDLSERQKQERLLKDMTGQELYRYNKDFRDFTYENPITKADLENLLYEQPGLFAGGGIAKIAGVDQGPPPESGPNSQGLSGLFKRVKNI